VCESMCVYMFVRACAHVREGGGGRRGFTCAIVKWLDEDDMSTGLGFKIKP